MKVYNECIYSIVKECTQGIDFIKEEKILKLVGVHGLNSLIENGFIESIPGQISGKPLYAWTGKENTGAV